MAKFVYETKTGSIAIIDDDNYMEVDNKWDEEFESNTDAMAWLDENGYEFVGIE